MAYKRKSSRRKTCPQCGEKRAIAHSRTLCMGCRRFNTDVALGRIKAPDYEEVTIEGYKEPMEKVQTGFGYFGAVTTTKDGELIQCHICGYYYANLCGHIIHNHKRNLKEYKIEYGLRINDGLVSPVMREKFQQAFEKHRQASGFGNDENNKKAWAAAKKSRDEGYQAGGDTWKPITRNEKGMCREQILAKVRHVVELNEGTATIRDMRDTYGKQYTDTIRTFFGSWPAAVKAAGGSTALQMKNKAFRKRKRDVIKRIKRWYKETGHPPYSSDFNSSDELPDQKWVSRHFGTLNKARRLAKVPEVVYINGQWEELFIDLDEK